MKLGMLRGERAAQPPTRIDAPFERVRDSRESASTVGTAAVADVVVTRSRSVPDLSIVVPTRNESGNVGELLRRLGMAIQSYAVEVIFVDDSDDSTPAAIVDAARRQPYDVTLRHRDVGQRAGGLSTAVVSGIEAARGEWVVVMDGDLQHPPELIETMVRKAQTTASDLVVATRYRDEGSGKALPFLRSVVSRVSTVAARALFPGSVKVSDPMSGFFVVRRHALRLGDLRPEGFKILLEILVRTPGLRVAEVPFEFGTRFDGESKASLHEGFRYVRHLARLRFQGAARLSRFAAVGASGLVVNTLALALLTEGFGFFYLIAATLATQTSTLWNFTLTEWWVFPDRRTGHRLVRGGAFFLVNNIALALRSPLLVLLVSSLAVHYLVANLLTLAAIMLARYLLADTLIWRRHPQPAHERAAERIVVKS